MATRGRSARSAVLASSVQRTKSSPYPSKARSALVRRSVLAVLVIGALALLTISFRSPTSGALHGLQGVGSSVLRPFQIAATRVATPFRDAYNYVDSLTAAKAQNRTLKAELQQLRAEEIAIAARAKEVTQLKRLLHYEEGRTFPQGYSTINTGVLSYPSGPFAHELTIEVGSSSGVRLNDPVVSGQGLVGHVTNVFPSTAQVTLLSDTSSAVSARDLHTTVHGIIKAGTGGTLILDQVAKQQVVHAGDVIVTDGTRSARYPSLYPYGIPIGKVSFVNATDTATFLQVQVTPFANLGSLDSVAVLVPKRHR